MRREGKGSEELGGGKEHDQNIFNFKNILNNENIIKINKSSEK